MEMDLLRQMCDLDPSIISVDVEEVSSGKRGGGTSDSAAVATLVTAMHAAARGGWTAALRGQGDQRDLSSRKRHIDALATEQAELVFGRSKLSIEVVAGEGPGEAMPGAHAGQRLGGWDSPTVDAWDGAFDYVDGTTLTAMNASGALSLGALGRGMRSVPDLQSYAMLVPLPLQGANILSSPELHAVPLLERVAELDNVAWETMRVLTHSSDTGPFHHDLIEQLQASGLGSVIVPEPVIIEPPYILSLSGLVDPPIHAMVGVFGLPELHFASALLDLLGIEKCFLLRPASLDAMAIRAHSLGPLFRFSQPELKLLAEHGMAPEAQYSSRDLVPSGSAECAVMFAVTANEMLQLPAPQDLHEVVSLCGLLVMRGGLVLRLQVRSSVLG